MVQPINDITGLGVVPVVAKKLSLNSSESSSCITPEARRMIVHRKEAANMAIQSTIETNARTFNQDSAHKVPVEGETSLTSTIDSTMPELIHMSSEIHVQFDRSTTIKDSSLSVVPVDAQSDQTHGHSPSTTDYQNPMPELIDMQACDISSVTINHNPDDSSVSTVHMVVRPRSQTPDSQNVITPDNVMTETKAPAKDIKTLSSKRKLTDLEIKDSFLSLKRPRIQLKNPVVVLHRIRFPLNEQESRNIVRNTPLSEKKLTVLNEITNIKNNECKLDKAIMVGKKRSAKKSISKQDETVRSCHQLDEDTKLEIGKYAAQHGNRRAARKFSDDLGISISDSSTCRYKYHYKQKFPGQSDENKESPDSKQRGGFPPELRGMEDLVSLEVMRFYTRGDPVFCEDVISIAKNLVCQMDQSLLKENGGDLQFSRSWAESIIDLAYQDYLRKFVQPNHF